MQQLCYSLSRYNLRCIHLYTLQTPQISHCPGHCLPDPPLPSLWSRAEEHEMRARKFISLDALWWHCSGHVYSGSTIPAPAPGTGQRQQEIPLQVMKAGDPNSQALAPKSCQHPAAPCGTELQWVLQLCMVPKPHSQLWLISAQTETSRNVNWCRGI